MVPGGHGPSEGSLKERGEEEKEKEEREEEEGATCVVWLCLVVLDCSLVLECEQQGVGVNMGAHM